MNRTQKLTLTSLAAALIFVATAFIRFPTGLGYINAGDGAVIIAGAFLGGAHGLIAASLGSALADLAAGYALYIPATAVIKGLSGLISGLLLKGKRSSFLRVLAVSALCEAVMLAGYFIYEALLYGASAAAASLLYNLLQAVSGIAIAVLGVSMLAGRLRKGR